MRTLILILVIAFSLVSSSAFAASYQLNSGPTFDPIQSTFGGNHPYSGINLGPGVSLPSVLLNNANLSSANLFGANLTGANLTGAFLNNANLGGADLPVPYIMPIPTSPAPSSTPSRQAGRWFPNPARRF